MFCDVVGVERAKEAYLSATWNFVLAQCAWGLASAFIRFRARDDSSSSGDRSSLSFTASGDAPSVLTTAMLRYTALLGYCRPSAAPEALTRDRVLSATLEATSHGGSPESFFSRAGRQHRPRARCRSDVSREYSAYGSSDDGVPALSSTAVIPRWDS